MQPVWMKTFIFRSGLNEENFFEEDTITIYVAPSYIYC